ncbi:MAG: LysR family hydrogen peroxide-inducible transcriptional activator, partial [Flavobacteriaceae bacterium]
MISIQQMQYILALSEERQFLRASEVCFVTQPTLSMQLKKAEVAMDSPIFDRSSSPLSLTPFGEELLPIIREILNEYGQIKTLSEKKKGVYKERIRVAIIPTIAGYMVPDMFKEWKELLFDVQLSIEELKTEEILVALDKKQIDVGILAGPVNNPKLRSTVLFREEIKAFIMGSEKEEIQTAELSEYHPWLLTQGNCLRTQMIHFCNLKKEEKEEWNYEGGNMDLLMKMVELHGGYTLIPEYSIKDNSVNYKRIRSENGEIPARELIALTSNRSTKWKLIEKMIRSIQLQYTSRTSEDE